MYMMVRRSFGKTGRGVAVAAAMLAAIGLTAAARPAHALSPAAGVGIGLGAFGLGSVLANPYNNPYYYPYGYYGGYYYPPAPAYSPAAPYYPPARSCWNAYSHSYYAC
jgi:hypothetical protein